MIEIYKKDLLKKANDYVWVHVSCALWNPTVIIEDFFNKEDIKSKLIIKECKISIQLKFLNSTINARFVIKLVMDHASNAKTIIVSYSST